jgi:hypothetical protein
LGPGSFGSGTSPISQSIKRWKRQDVPSSWGTLVCLGPVLRPRRDRQVRPYDVVGAAPARGTTRAPHDSVISGLHGTASALAVYASSAGLPAEDARLASGCWQLYQAGLVTRRVPTKGFRDASYIASSLPKLLGAIRVPFSCLLTPRARPRPGRKNRERLPMWDFSRGEIPTSWDICNHL